MVGVTTFTIDGRYKRKKNKEFLVKLHRRYLSFDNENKINKYKRQQ